MVLMVNGDPSYSVRGWGVGLYSSRLSLTVRPKEVQAIIDTRVWNYTAHPSLVGQNIFEDTR
jgi:hypothetical protein